MMEDDFTEDTADLAECVKMNFETVAKMAPAIAQHPIWQIAKMQLDALVVRLRDGDDD